MFMPIIPCIKAMSHCPLKDVKCTRNTISLLSSLSPGHPKMRNLKPSHATSRIGYNKNSGPIPYALRLN